MNANFILPVYVKNICIQYKLQNERTVAPISQNPESGQTKFYHKIPEIAKPKFRLGHF